MQVDAPAPTPTLRGVLSVENQMPNATVFSKVINGSPVKVQFGAKGYPGDVQRVPISLSEDMDFINSLEAGILKVVGGPPEIVESLRFETEQVKADREREESRYTDVLDRRQDRDIVGATCIGPAPANREGTCGRSIIQSAAQQKEVPPLCSQHMDLAPTFYLAEAGSKGEGATESRDGVVRREWRKVEMTQRRSL